MTKSELVKRLAAHYPELANDPDLRRQRIFDRIVARVFEEMSQTLEDGGRVELRGFGSFSVRQRDPRVGRNPRTGEAVAVASKRAAHFKAGKALNDKLNGRD